MIRLPDIPALSGSPVDMPGVRAGALGAPAAALTGLGKQLTEVSGQFFDTAIQMQKLTNARKASELRQKLETDYAGMQLELQKDPDPKSRIRKTQEFFQSRQGLFESEDLPPALRDELGEYYSKYASRAQIGAAEDAARLEIQRGKAAFRNEYEIGLNGRDREKISMAVNSAVQGGVLLPEEGERALRQFDEQETYLTERDRIQADPLEAEREMNSPDWKPLHLTPQQQDSLKREAEVNANRFRSDFANDMIINGTTPTLEDLQKMEESGVIDKSTHARWASNIRSNADAAPKQMDPAIYEETYTQILEYNPATDPSGRVEAQLRNWIASQPLPKEAIAELNSRFNERLSPPTTDGALGKLETEFAAKLRGDFARGDFGKYRYPFDHDNNPTTEPQMRVKQEDYEKAWHVRGQFAEAWRNELKRMPEDATFDQVEKAYKGLKESFKERTPAPNLNFTPRVPLPFDPDATFRKSTGQNFGGQPIKAPGGVYENAAATVFGGPNDPADNGKSAFGGATGPGGKEGVAIPQKLLAEKFPGKEKAWLAENVRTVVRAPNGAMRVLPVADLGTAEWVWQKNGRPTLDLTEGAAKSLGGEVIYQDGKLSGIKGLDNLKFAVVSIDTGGTPLAGTSWEDAKAAWFKANKPGSLTQADHGIIALREAWNMANAAETPRVKTADLRFPRDAKNLEDAQRIEPIPLHVPGTGELRPLTDGMLNTGEFSQYNVIQ